MSKVQNYVFDNSNSSYTNLKPVPVSAVKLTEGFWSDRLRVNTEVTVPYEFGMIRDDLFDKFRRAATLKSSGLGTENEDTPAPGRRAREANLHRWLEAASFTLAGQHNAELQGQVDEAIDLILPVQEDDGYLHVNLASKAMRNLRWKDARLNELYASGHMIQAAIAHHRNTGESRYLDSAIRVADHIYDVFGAGTHQHDPSHPVVEMALIELYRATGDSKYFDLACYFIDHAGFEDMKEIAGHSVQITFLLCAAIDAYCESGRQSYLDASTRLWNDMTNHKMYVTGAIGGRQVGEAMGQEYELPHEHGYAETCAAIGSAMWNWRALQIDGESKYADQMELCWFNSIMCGVNLAGDKFFYDNPHSSCGHAYFDPWLGNEIRDGQDYESYRKWVGAPTRQEWFWVDRDTPRYPYRVACCPPNLVRTIAQLPAYFYSSSDDGIWVHMYGGSQLDWNLRDGSAVQISQATNYPWDGEIVIEIDSQSPIEFTLHLRIPGWARSAVVEVDGDKIDAAPGRYLHLHRVWNPGAKVRLTLPMPVEYLVADSMVAEARDSIAVKRGPIVYAFEGIDNPDATVRRAAVPASGNPSDVLSEYKADLLDGVVSVEVPALTPAEGEKPLYRTVDLPESPHVETSLKGVPFFSWDNRGETEMTVWLRRHR